MLIFLDESGDLGFELSKAGTSRLFTITLLVCDDEQTRQHIQKAVRRTLKNKVNHKRKKTLVQELKGNSTSLEVKQYFLERLPKAGWYILAITVNKERVFDTLRTKAGKKKLYNFLTKELLAQLPKSNNSPETVNLTVDRCKDGEDRKDFNSYIQSSLETTFSLETSVYIKHEDSCKNPMLQAVDLFCWGIQNKEEGSGKKWYNAFKHHIKTHIMYLENEKKRRNQHRQIPQTHYQSMKGSI
jgi:hypothetical protein